MSRERILPPVQTLVLWRDEGLTGQQMADRVNATDERILRGDAKPVTRSAVSVALARANQADQRQRYGREIPWSPINAKHQKDHFLMLLRTWARVNRGDVAIPIDQLQRYENFAARAARENVVVDYDPIVGFQLVPRRPKIDKGLIREPPDDTN